MEDIAYGIFRDCQNRITIRKGEVAHQDQARITVNFDDTYWTYGQHDIGKTLFYNENEAEAAAEELKRRMRWT